MGTKRDARVARRNVEDTTIPSDDPQLAKMLDRLLAVQRPAVLANIRLLRRRRPHATPDQLITSLERQYLASVTAGGAAIGATAVVPGIGTAASVALSGAGAAGFLEASALFAQSVTEVHGIPLEDPERARALVLALMLGSTGTELVRQVATQATGGGAGLNQYWGSVVTRGMPSFLVGELADRAKHAFTRHFLAQQGAGLLGRALPFGIGAAVGGAGNAVLGRKIVASAREAFGPAPAVFANTLVLTPTRSERRAALSAGAERASEPLDLYVRDYGGNGERVALLLHGLAADSRIWYPLVPVLLEHGYRVLAPDLAGHGGSPRSRVYSPELWADDVRASLRQAPDLVVGHGLGALVATHLVEEYSPALALYLDPAFTEARGLAGLIPLRGERIGRVDTKRLRSEHPLWTDDQIELEAAMIDLVDPETARGLTDRDATAVPEAAVVPSVAIVPADPLASGPVAATLARHGFEVVSIPGRGHSVFREDRAALLAAVSEQLGAAGRAGIRPSSPRPSPPASSRAPSRATPAT